MNWPLSVSFLFLWVAKNNCKLNYGVIKRRLKTKDNNIKMELFLLGHLEPTVVAVPSAQHLVQCK